MVGVTVILLLGVVGMSGCRFLPRTQESVRDAPNYAEMLPVGWSMLGNVRAVNLNGTDANLLLFRFDMGQVGAMIFEEGTGPTLAGAHWLLPRHFGSGQMLGHGFIAPPATPVDEIRVDLLEAGENRGGGVGRELMIRGGESHLTFVWWDDQAAAYGVTQLVAPGGFRGVDWEAWAGAPKAIETLRANLPLLDYRARSQICRETVYVRRADLPGIVFDERPQGLRFCAEEFPAHPFYAEGVVLAYLLWPRPADAALLALLRPGVTVPQLDAELRYDRLVVEQIEDIAAPITLPLGLGTGAVDGVGVTTPVCVELSERANPNVRRWVVFTLYYLPVDGAARLPGRWTLSSAYQEPPPTPPQANYCEAILARRAP
jgi:hypothetical protein